MESLSHSQLLQPSPLASASSRRRANPHSAARAAVFLALLFMYSSSSSFSYLLFLIYLLYLFCISKRERPTRLARAPPKQAPLRRRLPPPGECLPSCLPGRFLSSSRRAPLPLLLFDWSCWQLASSRFSRPFALHSLTSSPASPCFHLLGPFLTSRNIHTVGLFDCLIV